MSNYETELQRLAMAFKALANPQRLKIFLRLASCCVPGCCATRPTQLRQCVGELGADLGLAPSTVSHHLKELRQAGLLEMERHGKQIECWVSDGAVQWLAGFFGNAPAGKVHRRVTRRNHVRDRA